MSVHPGKLDGKLSSTVLFIASGEHPNLYAWLDDVCCSAGSVQLTRFC